MLFIGVEKRMNQFIKKICGLCAPKEFEVSQTIISLIKMNIKHTDMKMKIGNSTSNAVHAVHAGLRQNAVFSPILFNTAIEKIINERRIDQNSGMC